MANLRGLKLGKSSLGLRFYWPVEMQYGERERLNKLVETRMRQLKRRASGCSYDLAIEEKYSIDQSPRL